MEAGLDHAFLQYIDVSPENQIPIRQFYLPMFKNCRHVIDLGCGSGDFVALLQKNGINATGVDSDPVACQSLRDRHLSVIEQDALTYLKTAAPNSVDGIYSAHMVEHMPYQAVLDLIRLSYQVLQPGGRLVLATPNPRALISHLELYHMHFGHEAFYHPRLLSFFMDYCGFEKIEDGENPATASTLLNVGPMPDGLTGPDQAAINYRRGFPAGSNLFHHLKTAVKTIVFKLFVQPFLDDIASQANKTLTIHQVDIQYLKTAIQRLKTLDRPFECYVIGYKSDTTEG